MDDNAPPKPPNAPKGRKDDDDLDDDDLDDREDRDDRESHGFSTRVIGDFARKALMSGIGAVFMSEETLRAQLGEMKLPKEAMGYMVGQADRTKKEIVEVVARETRAFLGRLEVEKMVGRMLVGTTIEINTRVRILPKEGGGLSLAVDKNESSLVKTDSEETAPKATSRRRRRRKDDPKED